MIYFTAFWWGIVSGVFSPCMWAMFPIVLGYVAYETADGKQSKAQGFVLSTGFVLGMAAMFAVLGSAISLVGNFFRLQESVISIIAGIILIAIGLGFLGLYEFRVPGFMNVDLAKPRRRGVIGAIILGVFGAIVMGPCGISYLTPVLTVALEEGRFVFGGVLSFIYGIGHGLPLIVLGTVAGVATTWLRKAQSAKKYIDIISGAALVGVGLYYLWKA